MKKVFIVLLFASPFFCLAQNIQSLDTIKCAGPLKENYVRQLYSDSLMSSFVIIIPMEVKEHKHKSHTEQVTILQGVGEMTLGDKIFNIKKGDVIFIPKNTFHSVKSKSSIPIKVLSVQTPLFDGKDRVLKEN